MAIQGVPSGTGSAPLPDVPQVGALAYNGITFSALYKSEIDGQVVQDEARRVTKYVEYTLSVDGLVTLIEGAGRGDPGWDKIRQALTAPGGALTYQDKGFGVFNVNDPGGFLWDVAWGPVPKILFFQPLGGSRAALIRWQVLVRVPELLDRDSPAPGDFASETPVLQFNYGSSLTYDDEGYTGYQARGTLEIPLTRTAQEERIVLKTVDNFRERWLNLATDLDNFRVTRRSFEFSRDRRTCEWEFACEELPPMGLPPGCTSARGTMSVRPLKRDKFVLGFLSWQVSLRCSYTVRKDEDRYVAALAFYSLLWFRMHCSARGQPPPPLAGPGNDPQQPARRGPPVGPPEEGAGRGAPGTGATRIWDGLFRGVRAGPSASWRAFLTDFSFDEGLYLDSKQVTFQASWWLLAEFTDLFRSTGAWRWLEGSAGGRLWAQSVADVQGWRSWLINAVDPVADVLIDVGQFSKPGPPLD